MITWLNNLFSETSSVSCMRVMSVASLLIGAGIAVYGVQMKSDLGGVSELVAVFVGAAFGGKVTQKLIEAKAVAK